MEFQVINKWTNKNEKMQRTTHDFESEISKKKKKRETDQEDSTDKPPYTYK